MTSIRILLTLLIVILSFVCVSPFVCADCRPCPACECPKPCPNSLTPKYNVKGQLIINRKSLCPQCPWCPPCKCPTVCKLTSSTSRKFRTNRRGQLIINRRTMDDIELDSDSSIEIVNDVSAAPRIKRETPTRTTPLTPVTTATEPPVRDSAFMRSVTITPNLSRKRIIIKNPGHVRTTIKPPSSKTFIVNSPIRRSFVEQTAIDNRDKSLYMGDKPLVIQHPSHIRNKTLIKPSLAFADSSEFLHLYNMSALLTSCDNVTVVVRTSRGPIDNLSHMIEILKSVDINDMDVVAQSILHTSLYNNIRKQLISILATSEPATFVHIVKSDSRIMNLLTEEEIVRHKFLKSIKPADYANIIQTYLVDMLDDVKVRETISNLPNDVLSNFIKNAKFSANKIALITRLFFRKHTGYAAAALVENTEVIESVLAQLHASGKFDYLLKTAIRYNNKYNITVV